MHLAESESLEDDHEQDVRLNVREPGIGAQLLLSCRPARCTHTWWVLA